MRASWLGSGTRTSATLLLSNGVGVTSGVPIRRRSERSETQTGARTKFRLWLGRESADPGSVKNPSSNKGQTNNHPAIMTTTKLLLAYLRPLLTTVFADCAFYPQTLLDTKD